MNDKRPTLYVGELKTWRDHGLANAFLRTHEQRQVTFVTNAFWSLMGLFALRIEMSPGRFARRHLAVLHGWPAVTLFMDVKAPLRFW